MLHRDTSLRTPDGFPIWYRCLKCSCYLMKFLGKGLLRPCFSSLAEAGFAASSS